MARRNVSPLAAFLFVALQCMLVPAGGNSDQPRHSGRPGLEFAPSSQQHRQLAGIKGKAAAAATRRRLADDAVHSAVAYGTRATDRTIPYIAALLDSGNTWAGCGGSLIRPRLVVTAAHCVVDDNLRPQDVKAVYIGLVDWATDTAKQYEHRKVVRIVRHPKYNPSTVAYDIALLVLDKPAKTKPVALAPQNFKLIPRDLRPNGDVLLSAGWGQTHNAPDADHLMVARLPFISRAGCNDIMEYELDDYPVPTTSLCAGYSTDNEDTCPGDSGGPLVKKRPIGDVLVGIVSYGPSVQTCGGDANLGVYTSVMVMRPWIDGQIRTLKL